MAKKEIERMCLVSREMKNRKFLIRLVFDKETQTWSLDLSNRKHGRGYYISADLDLIDLAEKRAILQHTASMSKQMDLSAVYDELRKVTEDRIKEEEQKNRKLQIKRVHLSHEQWDLISGDKDIK